MKYTTAVITVLLALFAFSAFAQTSIYVGGGTSATADGPALNVTTGICDADSTNCALINYAAKASVANLKDITYTTTAGVRRVVARAASTAGNVELFLLADGGAAVSGSGPSPTGAAGGGITYHPAKAPNWGVSFAAQGAYDSANKQHANVFFQVGYTFRGK